MEDEAIVHLFVARDETAIQQTQTKYGSRLKYLAYEITQDMEMAEECENDVYLGAWNAIPPHEPYHYLYCLGATNPATVRNPTLLTSRHFWIHCADGFLLFEQFLTKAM